MIDTFHITPEGDLKPHILHAGCKCQPRVEDGGRLIVHNAWDGREFFEADESEAVNDRSRAS